MLSFVSIDPTSESLGPRNVIYFHPNVLAHAMTTYDSLHRQCRTLESLFDSKLTSYSRLASTISRNDSDIEASGSGERWKDLQNEVQDLLEKVCAKHYSCVSS